MPTHHDTQSTPATAPTVLRAGNLWSLGVPHAFTTRLGGASPAPFDSLNFGNPGDLARERKDPPANIRENQRRVLGAIGAAGREVVEVWQDHGRAVVVVERGEALVGVDGADTRDTRADAIVTNDARRAVGVRVADCAPVLLASADGAIVAAVHAGWRGVITGVVSAALDEMRRLGAGRVLCAIGPCIGVEAFEVGEEVATEFERVFGPGTPIVRRDIGVSGKAHVDLKRALHEQLESGGVRPSDFETLPGCSVRDSKLFFSHRRDRGLTGRMLGVIGPRAS